MIETMAHEYFSEITQQELSNEYHYWTNMAGFRWFSKIIEGKDR